MICLPSKPDPFAEDDTTELGSKQSNYIHIRIQQRNGRKTLTTVQGLPSELDFKRVLQAFKRVCRLYTLTPLLHCRHRCCCCWLVVLVVLVLVVAARVECFI
jgi:hypothetical protein